MRLFFAIDFPEPVKEQLDSDLSQLRKKYPDFKWVRKQSMHLTLKFLGEIPRQKVNEIVAKAGHALSAIENFKLTTLSAGFFPGKKRPRVFFAGLDSPDQLEASVTALEESLYQIGIEKENRKFHPHLTLARIKNPHLKPHEINELENFSFASFSVSVDEIILMQSTLTPAGARYTPVQKFSLRTI